MAVKAVDRGTLWGFILAAAVLEVVGGALAAANWPGEETKVGKCTSIGLGDPICDPDKLVDTGNVPLTVLGLAFGGIGSALMLVALVAFGVVLGSHVYRQEKP